MEEQADLDDSIAFILSIRDSGRDSSETSANIYLTVWCHIQKLLYALVQESFYVRTENCEERLLAATCLSVRPRGTIRLSQGRFQ